MPDITVVICTHNRADLLARAFSSLAAQTLPPDQYELLVVDNASTDGTPLAVQELMARMPCVVRYCREEQLGIAYARNRGWREAGTKYVAYLDDDAAAEAHWLESLVAAFANAQPQPACVAGFIELDWEGGRPEWFPSQYESLLARYDNGPVPGFLGPRDYLLTCNAAFRLEALRELGGFNEGLGHRGRFIHGGEDNDIHSRLVARGLLVYYQPEARVLHLIPPERQTRRHLLGRLFASGLTQGALDAMAGEIRGKAIWTRAGQDARALARYGLHAALAVVRGRLQEMWSNVYGLVQVSGRLRSELAIAGFPLTRDDATRSALWGGAD